MIKKEKETEMEMTEEKQKIILDTDIGGDIDDTWALAMLLGSPECDLKLVSTVSRTDYRARLTAKYLQLCGRSDVPVSIGTTCPKVDKFDQQGPWLEGFQLSDYAGKVYPDSVEAIIETMDQTPGIVTFIEIGPMTNLALVLEKRPDLAERMDCILLAGSVYKQYLGVPGVCSEYNVLIDIPAAKKVFSTKFHRLRISPLDSCGTIFLKGEEYERLRAGTNHAAQELFAIYDVWSKYMAEMENRDHNIDPAHGSSLLADVIAIHIANGGAFLQYETLPLIVSDLGETLIDHENGNPVEVAVELVNEAEFCKDMVDRILSAG